MAMEGFKFNKYLKNTDDKNKFFNMINGSLFKKNENINILQYLFELFH